MPQPPNLQKMLADAQAMLAAQQEAQETLTIDPDAVDPEDVEMLQDMVVAAVNEALRMAEELQQSKLGAAEGAGGFDPMSALESLGLGGLGGALGGGGMPPGAGGGGNRAARRAQQKKR
jgi:nucleoid-associated protein EbfC